MIVHVCPPDGRTFRTFRDASDAAAFAAKHSRKVIGVRKDIARGSVIVRRSRDGKRTPVRVSAPDRVTSERYIVTLSRDVKPRRVKSRLVRVIMSNGIRLSADAPV